MKDLAWCIDPIGIEKFRYPEKPTPYGYQKCEILIIETHMVSRNDDNSPTLVKPRIQKTSRLTFGSRGERIQHFEPNLELKSPE